MKEQPSANPSHIVEDMDNLRHMLGVGSNIRKRDWGYRNYYNASEQDAVSMRRLEAAGLVVNTHRDYWSATEAGCKAIGLDQKTIKRVFSRG